MQTLAELFPLHLAQEKSAKRTRMLEAELGKITEMAQRVAVSEGLTLVDVELKGGRGTRLLRVYIDRPEGISHADCALVSEQLSAMLDVEDPFPGSYTLEVSSPGLDRKLVKASDFVHFVGRKARVVVREPVDNQKVWEGRLAGFEAGRVRLDLGEAGLMEIELDNIQKAQLVVEF
jgi:ribosome maturation factor RimP